MATQGMNRVVGNAPQRIVSQPLAVLDGAGEAGRTPELWACWASCRWGHWRLLLWLRRRKGYAAGFPA